MGHESSHLESWRCPVRVIGQRDLKRLRIGAESGTEYVSWTGRGAGWEVTLVHKAQGCPPPNKGDL